jgi:hypothetical protein
MKKILNKIISFIKRIFNKKNKIEQSQPITEIKRLTYSKRTDK